MTETEKMPDTFKSVNLPKIFKMFGIVWCEVDVTPYTCSNFYAGWKMTHDPNQQHEDLRVWLADPVPAVEDPAEVKTVFALLGVPYDCDPNFPEAYQCRLIDPNWPELEWNYDHPDAYYNPADAVRSEAMRISAQLDSLMKLKKSLSHFIMMPGDLVHTQVTPEKK